MITSKEILLALLGAVLGQLLVILYWIAMWLRSLHGPLAGWWEDRIFDGQECIKSDYVRLYHVGDCVIARVARRYSRESEGVPRNWYFTGRRDGNELFGVLWEVARRAPRGVAAFLTQHGDEHFEGKYLRLHDNRREVKAIRVELHRLTSKPRDWDTYWEGRWWHLSWLRVFLQSIMP